MCRTERRHVQAGSCPDNNDNTTQTPAWALQHVDHSLGNRTIPRTRLMDVAEAEDLQNAVQTGKLLWMWMAAGGGLVQPASVPNPSRGSCMYRRVAQTDESSQRCSCTVLQTWHKRDAFDKVAGTQCSDVWATRRLRGGGRTPCARMKPRLEILVLNP
jgi:hypothetical protein